jgi:hypothetical protein
LSGFSPCRLAHVGARVDGRRFSTDSLRSFKRRSQRNPQAKQTMKSNTGNAGTDRYKARTALLRLACHRACLGTAINQRLKPPLARSTFDSCRAEATEGHSSQAPSADIFRCRPTLIKTNPLNHSVARAFIIGLLLSRSTPHGVCAESLVACFNEFERIL